MATPPRARSIKNVIPMEGEDATFDFLNTSRERSASRFRASDHFVGAGPMQMNGRCCGMGRQSFKMRMRNMSDLERAPNSSFRIWNEHLGDLFGFRMGNREPVFDFDIVYKSI